MVIHKWTHFLATLEGNGYEIIPVTKLCKTSILLLPSAHRVSVLTGKNPVVQGPLSFVPLSQSSIACRLAPGNNLLKHL